MTVYAPRVTVHTDRTGNIKSGPNRLLVVHTTEGGEGDAKAEQTAASFALPGDRPSSSGGFYGSSYQYVIDTDRVIPAVIDGQVSYSAAGGNHDGIHFVIPGTAYQTRAQWLDTVSRAAIRQLAAVMVDKSIEHDIPLVRLTTAQVADGVSRGYCGHVNVSEAFHKSTHTDPGVNFPWDVLASDLATLTQPEDDRMSALATPARLLDTRLLGNPATSGQLVTVSPPNRPTWAKSVVVNITITQPDAAGYVTAWADGARPLASNANFTAGQTVANVALVPLDDAGRFVVSPQNASCHLVIDQQGWAT